MNRFQKPDWQYGIQTDRSSNFRQSFTYSHIGCKKDGQFDQVKKTPKKCLTFGFQCLEAQKKGPRKHQSVSGGFTFRAVYRKLL